jgi:hypothetical protein
MKSVGANRARHQLRPKGPAALRVAAVFLGATPLLFLAFWGLGLLANLSLSMLPGSQEPVDLRWVFGLACAGGAMGAALFEWGLRTGVRRAAEMAEAGDQIGAARQLAEVTGHGLEWSAAAVQSYLDERPAASPGVGELPEEVRRLAAAGDQLRAVARLRELSGAGAEEAIRHVEAFLAERAKNRRSRRCSRHRPHVGFH